MLVELRKKAVHIGMGLGFVWLIHKGWLNVWLLFALVALLSLAVWARGRLKAWDRFLALFDRKDKKGGVGALWFVLGVLLVWLVFHDYPRLVAASIMVLTFGDTASSIIGRRWGEVPNPLDRHKYIEGTAAGIFFAFVGAWIFVGWIQALIGAIVAMVIEAMDFHYKIYTVDDNLMMPLIAALAMFPLL